MAEEIVNRVKRSALVTIDLEDHFPEGERVLFDIEQCLWQGLVLKEKDFRAFVKEHEWDAYAGKHVAIHCSADAIVPTWAYMLLATCLEPLAKTVIFGDLAALEDRLFQQAIQAIDPTEYEDARVVIKGCSKLPVPDSAYVELTAKLRPYIRSVMYGEPCSTVPLYKKPRK